MQLFYGAWFLQDGDQITIENFRVVARNSEHAKGLADASLARRDPKYAMYQQRVLSALVLIAALPCPQLISTEQGESYETTFTQR